MASPSADRGLFGRVRKQSRTVALSAEVAEAAAAEDVAVNEADVVAFWNLA